MKINTEIIKATYKISKDVYNEIYTKNNAINFLEKSHGMNRGSASDYIGNFKKMMDGEVYTRTCNTEATDYFFTKIYDDFGVEQLRKVIKSVIAHVNYQDLNSHNNLNSIRDVILKHQNILKTKSKP